jgi:hypothetical protein
MAGLLISVGAKEIRPCLTNGTFASEEGARSSYLPDWLHRRAQVSRNSLRRKPRAQVKRRARLYGSVVAAAIIVVRIG